MLNTGIFDEETVVKVYELIQSSINRAFSIGAIPLFDTYSGGKLNLKKDSEFLTASSYYEDDIYDLVRIYKTFDWNKNVLLFLRW